MCGIAGRISTRVGPVGYDIVEMAACMHHRGPDSTGFAVYGISRESGLVVRAHLDDRWRLDSALDSLRSVTKVGSDFAADPRWDDTTQRHVSVRAGIEDVDDDAATFPAIDPRPLTSRSV
jgi:glutamine phosphoribosylpyrophosphate amidotransferase